MQERGLIQDLFFEEGILFTIEDEPMTNDTLTVKASKWRSGLGAIVTDKMVLKKDKDNKLKNTWKLIEENGHWIS